MSGLKFGFVNIAMSWNSKGRNLNRARVYQGISATGSIYVIKYRCLMEFVDFARKVRFTIKDPVQTSGSMGNVAMDDLVYVNTDHIPVPGTRFLVPGTRYLVLGTRYLVEDMRGPHIYMDLCGFAWILHCN